MVSHLFQTGGLSLLLALISGTCQAAIVRLVIRMEICGNFGTLDQALTADFCKTIHFEAFLCLQSWSACEYLSWLLEKQNSDELSKD
jgi:hypothetical protein